MIVPLDESAFIGAQVPFERDEEQNHGVFTIPDVNDPQATQQVRVTIVKDQLHFFPERSSAHKRVLAALGLNT